MLAFTLGAGGCGSIDELRFADQWYQRVGGVSDDGSGNPPDGWDNPQQRGALSRSGNRVVFTDSKGHREVFELRPGATSPKRMCA